MAAVFVVLASSDTFAEDTQGQPRGLRAYGELEGQVAAMSGPLSSGASGPALGYQIDVAFGPRTLPLLFGVGLGILALGNVGPGGSSASAPWLDEAEIRHGELSVRLEPDFHYVRPFVEASAGVAMLYLTPAGGAGDDTYQADLALSRSVCAGLDLEPWGRQGAARSGGSFVLTIGYRMWESGPLHYSATNMDGSSVIGGGPLRVQGPYLGLTVFGWS